MQRGLKMFLVKMLFVVSWFSQFLGVLSAKDLDYYCGYKSCQVAICRFGKLTRKTQMLGFDAFSGFAAAEMSGIPPEHLPTDEEMEVLKEWKLNSIVRGITPRKGFCALILLAVTSKVSKICPAHCRAQFDCEEIVLSDGQKRAVNKIRAIFMAQVRNEEAYKAEKLQLLAEVEGLNKRTKEYEELMKMIDEKEKEAGEVVTKEADFESLMKKHLEAAAKAPQGVGRTSSLRAIRQVVLEDTKEKTKEEKAEEKEEFTTQELLTYNMMQRYLKERKELPAKLEQHENNPRCTSKTTAQ